MLATGVAPIAVCILILVLFHWALRNTEIDIHDEASNALDALVLFRAVAGETAHWAGFAQGFLEGLIICSHGAGVYTLFCLFMVEAIATALVTLEGRGACLALRAAWCALFTGFILVQAWSTAIQALALVEVCRGGLALNGDLPTL